MLRLSHHDRLRLVALLREDAERRRVPPVSLAHVPSLAESKPRPKLFRKFQYARVLSTERELIGAGL